MIKHIWLWIALTSLFLLLVRESPEDNTKAKTKTYCTTEQLDAEICYTLYSPVCGSDGNTYTNDCVACNGKSPGFYYVGGECTTQSCISCGG